MFYGWRVVAGTFVSQLFVVGFFTYAVSLLVAPVREEFGVSLEQVMYSLSVATLIGLVATPVGGVMMDRLSIRWLVTAGALFYALGLALLAKVETITGYIVMFALTMSIANVLAGSMAASTVISRWFTASRGRALGVSAVGVSVGGMLIPRLLAWWIEDYGWRDALTIYSGCIVLIMLPAVAILLRGKPADVGLEPEKSPDGASLEAEQVALTLGDILKKPQYWFLGVSLGMIFSTYSSTMSNITPYVVNAGLEVSDAAIFLMVVAVVGFLGKLVFGFAADKMNLKFALWLVQACLVAGYIVLASNPGYMLMLLGAVLMGLSAGGMLPVWGALVARLFGLLSYGRAMGLMGPLITLCILPGYTAVGRLFDTTGSYNTGLLLFSGVAFLSMLLLVPLKLDSR